MLFVSIQRGSFVCQQRLEALNEHPLQLFWARQHGRGEGHRLRLWIRNGSSAWLAGPETTSSKAKNRHKIVFTRPFFRMSEESTKPVRRGLKIVHMMKITLQLCESEG